MKKAARISCAAMAVLVGAGAVANGNVKIFNRDYVQAQSKAEEASTKTVIGKETEWKYLDNNTDPSAGLASLTAWTEKGFDDASWKKAVGKFGAKKGAIADLGNGCVPNVLLNQYMEDGKTDIPTFFFRTKFQVSDIDKLTSVTGTLYHDDAMAVYVNGHRIADVDMPQDKQENNLFYAGSNGGSPKLAEIQLAKDQIKEYLTEGENTLAVEVHNDRASSSDIYFSFENLELNYNEEAEEQPVEQKSVILNVGSTEKERNLTWYVNRSESGEVQYALKSAMENGDFPKTYQTAKAVTSEANDLGFYSNQAEMKNLEQNTEYVYRVKNGETVSKTYTFTTGKEKDSFRFVLAGDPQIGTGNLQNGIDGWNTTLEMIQTKINPDFLVSAGDQVNTAANETEYTGYLNDALASLASASSIGNHDSGSNAYGQHFNLPNESADKGVTTAGSDYWFVYDNTLFMDLNSNDKSTAEHKAFMEEAIAANPDVKWKTVVFHHSIYSTASHATDSDIEQRREELSPVFKELDIDVVLMGHDHVYTRSYMMDGLTPDKSEGVQSSVTEPEGILYLTANSASGSKYYDIKVPDAEYAAKMDQSYRRTITDIQVSDTEYSMTTYYADDMTVLDTFTIYKTPEKDTTLLEQLVQETGTLKEEDYTAESWNAVKDALTEAEKVLKNESAGQEEVDKAYNTLKDAVDNLQPVDDGTDSGDTDKPDDGTGSGDTDKPDDGTGSGNTDKPSNGTGSGNTDKPSSGTGVGNTDKPSSGTGTGNTDKPSNGTGAGNTDKPNNGTNVSKNTAKSPVTGDTANAAAMVMAAVGSIVVLEAKRKRNV